VFARFCAELGPLAVVDLETTGLSPAEGAEILELGVLLVDPDVEVVTTLSTLLHPAGPIPRAVKRLTGIGEADVAEAPALAEVATCFRDALAGRVLVAHNAGFERSFLSRFLDPGLAEARYLDTLDLLSLTHPDAPDLRLESFTRMLFETEEHHRALDDALDTARVMSRAGLGCTAGEARFVRARRALEAYAPESPWLALLAKPGFAERQPRPVSPFVVVGETTEPAVPFDEDAIAAVLADEPRGRRHFPGFRVRSEQITLARRFARNLAAEEVLLAEGGTGVGKSLAYLAAVIPFAMEREEQAAPSPVVISTRTKLLQDQLLLHDIAAAARFLGWPELRAVAIKGRANYVCGRRVEGVLVEGRDQSLFAEDRLAFAALDACAHTRTHGEIGGVPAALLRRYPALRGLLRRSVASRADQCTREQCARKRSCPLGTLREALGRAHLIVANHDLLLRWPPDYPAFEHAIVDEAHELSSVADEAYACEVRPDEVLERFDEIFGRPAAKGRKRGPALLPAADRKALEKDARAWRRDLYHELRAIGHDLADMASDFGEVQVPLDGGPRFAAAAAAASAAAGRLDAVTARIPEGLESGSSLDRAAADLSEAAVNLRLPFEASSPDSVASFEGMFPPFDRWRLAVRAVSPAATFDAEFFSRMRSFSGVSASLFIRGEAFAALGDLELEERAGERLQRVSVPSPFPYDRHMRVVALRGGTDLVQETSSVLEDLGRRLGGRTLGLFTSLRRMNEVGDELATRLREEGIDVITPRRATDDPGALITRFVHGAAVLLGARRFWQGVDIPGDALQAVVIEKLPFEVPTELRRRRDRRLEERGFRAFEKATLGRMPLNLKQMVGRLIRSEEDRGIVVIVEGRPDKRYFRRLAEALPEGSEIRVARAQELGDILSEVRPERGRSRVT